MLPWDQQKNNLQITNRIQSEKAPFKWAGGKNRMFKKYWASGFFPESEEPDLFVDMFAIVHYPKYFPSVLSHCYK